MKFPSLFGVELSLSGEGLARRGILILQSTFDCGSSNIEESLFISHHPRLNLKRISVEKPKESHLGRFYFYQVGNEIANLRFLYTAKPPQSIVVHQPTTFMQSKYILLKQLTIACDICDRI